ncbi:MAG: AI-2E family transporter [Alcanivoracaceae bacterium]|uniref:AI-2E family transporter n=1 Tax=Alcanivorax sp. MD8A TaxID=1177157 RepID=UPI000C679015|nr:AI-2E family transporter [Alcanivorax sp. MD8A]MAX55544.1 AI-2E family transporter [Alcanivoracaceae bacterium]MCG8436826.1 AI-2E family transporter [Pseudomonadales bacterium]MEE2870036.1 AI-2E family transporter [Pseudomonadota bacterium]PNE03401.1 permease PerM [Alcanivorax sp. MD8A]|tara:strand:- start:3273 stop:4358 length:1086 start_codon:yes stop_codon:yes gene_type:complete
MLRILRNWADQYFSDEEAVYLLVVLLAAGLLIAFFGGMLAPVLAAIVIAYLMQGLVSGLERRGMRRMLAVNLVFALFLGLLVMTLVLLLPMVWRQTALLVQEQLPHVLKNGEAWLRELPVHYPEVISLEQVNSVIAVIQRQVAEAGQGVLTLSLASIPNIVEVMVFLVLLPLLVFFFLKDKDAIVGWLMQFLPSRRRVLSHVWHEMDGQIANYVRGKAVEILLVGSVTFIAFVLLDMHYAVLLGVLVGLSVVVPYIGATVVTLPVAAVAYVQFGWSGEFALVMVVYGIIQFIDGNILVPLLFSEAVNLHPVAIITAILLFGGLWGLWGVFFAIPLATLFKAVLNAWPREGSYPVAEQATGD